MFITLGVYVVVFTIFANLIICYLVIRNKARSATHYFLMLLAVLLALWTLFNYLALSPGSEETRLFWVRAVMFVTTPFGPLIFLLATVFPNSPLKLGKPTAFFLVILGLTSLALAFSPYMFSSLSNLPDGGFSLEPGLGIVIFGINLIFFLVYGFYRLIDKYRHSEGSNRTQLAWFLFGTSIAFTLMTLTNFVAVVVFRSIQLTFLGPTCTLIMIGSITYAVIRHQLFDIKVVATEIFSFVILVILIAKLFVPQSPQELVVDMFIFSIVLFFVVFLNKSVANEVKQREELQTLNRRLKDLDKQKDEFLNIASHELRAPMTAVKGYISMVREGDGGEIPAQARELLDEAAEEGDRMVRLVNNMLNVARIEEGRMVYEIGEVSLSSVVHRVFEEFKFDAENKKLEYVYEPPEHVLDRVVVDVDRIHEVVANLINNAVKYTDTGRVEVRLSNPSPQVVRFEVADTGPGMTEEEMSKLFQKFYRAESYVGKKMGTGLGLYISKLLVEKFDGKIGVSSQKGKGSLFWFELPLRT